MSKYKLHPGFPFRLIAILAILLAVPVTILLSQQQQNLKQSAYRGDVEPRVNCDVDGNKKTDRADYFRLLYCLQNSNKCINIKADINLDGKVNSKDLTQWKQYCAGNTGGSPYPSQYPIPSLNPSEYLSQYPLPSNQPTLTPKPF